MNSGLRVEVGVSAPGDCPVADASAETGRPVTDVSRASEPDETGRVAEEFAVPASATPPDGKVDRVATYDTRAVYRFRRSRDRGCVCERVEAFGHPVSEIHAADGTLYVSFHAPNLDDVRAIVDALEEQFSGVRLRRLTRADGGTDADPVFVDRSRLTARQREALRTAHEMGYFDYPKGANAGEVAEALDISPSTLSEHLAAAQGKILDALLTA